MSPRRVLSSMSRDGLAVLDGLFPLSLLKKVRAEVLRRHESGELRRKGLVRDIGGRYTAVLPLRGPFLNPALYANPKLLKLLPALLGEHYRLSSVEAVISLPGSSAQYQHIDGPVRFDRGGRGYAGDLSGLPPYALALATPLCDATEENGPTVLWAGSHRAALRPKLPSERRIRREFEERRMVGPFGRSYLYDYRTFHRGTPNMSREPRPLLMLVFARSWYSDPNLFEVSHGLAISRSDLAKVAPRHRFLFASAPAARRPLWT